LSDPHVVRDDFPPAARIGFERRLAASVATAAAATPGAVVVHRGTDPRDVAHAARVAAAAEEQVGAPVWRAGVGPCVSAGEQPPGGAPPPDGPPGPVGGGVVVVEHSGCAGHLLTGWLKQRGELEGALGREVQRHCAGY
jgi:hypothetical protein